MIITFCGHSDYCVSQADEEKLLSFFEEAVGDTPVEFYLGGYGAFDSFARVCVQKFQKTHPKARLVLVLPYLNRKVDSQLYDETVYPPLESVPPRFAISHRNKWMVEQADLVVACVSRTFGGAVQTYSYAKKKKKPIFHLGDANIGL